MTNKLGVSQINLGNLRNYSLCHILIHLSFATVLLYFIFNTNQYQIPIAIIIAILSLNLFRLVFDRDNKNVQWFIFSLICIVPLICFVAIYFPDVRYEGLLLLILALSAKSYSAQSNVVLLMKILLGASILLLGYELIESSARVPTSSLVSHSLLLFFVGSIAIHFWEYFQLQQAALALQNLSHAHEDDFESIFAQSYDPMAIYDYKENRFVKANDGFVRMIGYDLNELNAMSESGYKPLIYNEDSIDQFEQVQNNLKQGKSIEVNSVLTSKLKEKVSFKSLFLPSKSNRSLYFIILKNKTLEIKKNEQLRASKDNYQSIFDNNLLGVTVLDEAGLMKETNDSFTKFVKGEKAVLFGASIYDYIHQKDQESFQAFFADLKEGVIEFFSTDVIIVDASGNEFMTAIAVNSIFKNDEFVSAIVTIKNISKQWEAEQKLKASELRYKSVFRNSLGGIAIVKDREFIEVNAAFLSIIQANREDVLGKDPEDFLYEEDKDFVLGQLFDTSNKNIDSKQVIHRIKYKDTVRHVAGHLSRLSEEDGTYLLSCVDVTDLLAAQLSLTNYTATLDTVIYNAPDSIIALNNDLEIMVMNDKAREILSPFVKPGFSIDIGSNFTESISVDYFSQCCPKPYGLVLEGQADITDITVTTGTEARQFNRKLSPLVNSTGQIIGCVEILSDITEAKKKEAEIELGRRKYKDIFDNSYEGILLVDYDTTHIVDGNHRMITLLGLNPEDSLSNYSVNEFIHEKQIDKVSKTEVISTLVNQIKEKEKVTRILTGRTVAGGEFIASITVIKDFNEERRRLVFFIDDVTDEYTSKLELEHSNQLYTTLFNYSFDGIDILELKSFDYAAKTYDAVLMSRNNKGASLIGNNNKTYLYPEEIQSMLYDDVPLTDIKAKLDISFTELSTKGYSKSRWIIRDQDDRKRHVDFNVNIVVVNGKTLLVRMTNDITEELEAIQAVSKSEYKYRRLINTLPGGVLQCDPQGKIDYISNGAALILGYDKLDLIGHNVLDIVTTKYRKLFEDYIADSIAEDQMEIITIEINQEDEGVVYIDVRAKASENKDDGNHMIITFYESTARVLAEQAKVIVRKELDERNVLYKTMIESSFTGIDVIKLDGQSDLMNQSRLLIRNNKMREIIGNEIGIFIGDETLSSEYNNMLKAKGENIHDIPTKIKQNNTVLNYDYTLERDGQMKYLEVMNSIVEVNDQRLLVRHILDVTERKKKDSIIFDQLDELNVKNDELEKYIESNLQLENFAYIASHDLKAPLRTVSSFAYLLKKNAYQNLDDKSKKYLDIIVTSSNNMQVLINDLLQFARINTDKLHISPVKLAELFKRCRSELSESIQKVGASLSIHNMPRSIDADEIKLGQLLQNLIRNGIKFVRPGVKPQIKIDCKDGEDEWVFSVSDNGIGIKEENKSRIFVIFEKLHSNDIYEGTGLGLTICKKVVEKHQGRIWLESEEGVGTTFYFTIKKNLSSIKNDEKSNVKSIDAVKRKEAVVA